VSQGRSTGAASCCDASGGGSQQGYSCGHGQGCDYDGRHCGGGGQY